MGIDAASNITRDHPAERGAQPRYSRMLQNDWLLMKETRVPKRSKKGWKGPSSSYYVFRPSSCSIDVRERAANRCLVTKCAFVRSIASRSKCRIETLRYVTWVGVALPTQFSNVVPRSEVFGRSLPKTNTRLMVTQKTTGSGAAASPVPRTVRAVKIAVVVTYA